MSSRTIPRWRLWEKKPQTTPISEQLYPILQRRALPAVASDGIRTAAGIVAAREAPASDGDVLLVFFFTSFDLWREKELSHIHFLRKGRVTGCCHQPQGRRTQVQVLPLLLP